MKHFKLILVLLNLVFGLCGLLIFLQSSLTLVQSSPYTEFSGSKYVTPLFILVATGIGFMVTGFVGCIVATKCKDLAQSIVSCVFLVLLLVQISTCIISVFLKNDLETTVKVNMLMVIEKYTNGEEDQLLDVIQSNFQCCGANSIADWFTRLQPATNTTVPLSCCNTDGAHCKWDYLPPVDPSPELEFYTKGCGPLLADFLKVCHRTLDIAGMVTVLVEVFCLIVMFYHIRRGKVSKATIYEAVSSQIT